MSSQWDVKPTTLGSGRQIGGGIPEPDDYGQVELGSGREATYKTSGAIALPEDEDLTQEPVPSGRGQPESVEPKPTEKDAVPAFPMSKMPDANLSDAEHEKEVGWWKNSGYGLLNRAADDLLTNLSTFGNKVVDQVTDAIPGSEYTPMVAGARAAAGYIGEAGEAIGGNDYRVRGDWETVENAWAELADGEVTVDTVTDAAKQTGEFMLETGIVSLPDMFAMMVGMPAYLASRVEELATERAQNDGRESASAEDYAVGGTTATIVTAIDRMSLGFATKPLKRLLEKGFAPALKRIAGATVVEAGQEAVQEQLEYLGTGVGTEAGVTAEEAKRRSLAGAVGGAGFGAAVSTASNVAGAFKSPPADAAPPVEGGEPVPAGETEVGVKGDDDYLPTAEEQAVTDEDLIPPPTPVTEDVVEEPETDTGEAKGVPGAEQEAEAKPVPTAEDNLRKAWKEAPQKVPAAAVDKAVTMGLHPADVEFTGKDGAYKAGDVDVALNINKVGDTDETIAAALKAAGKEEEADGAAPTETASETTDTETVKPTAKATTEGSGGSDRGVVAEPSSGTDEATAASEEAGTAAEEKPALTKKFSRKPYGVEAAELGLTDADFEGIEPNAQGVHTKGNVEKAKANKAKRDRGAVRSETQQVLDFIEDNLPKSDKYATEKTGRSRAGGLETKATAVSSLVTLVDQLSTNSSAPQAVIDRALELAGGFRRLSGLNAEQMAGKGFTSVVNAATLDPAIDELTELVTALDQNREADAAKVGKTETKLVEQAEAAEVKAVEDAKPLTPEKIGEQKSALAVKRKNIKEIEQGIRRGKSQNKEALLAETAKKLAEVNAAESLLDEQANVLEKATPTGKKRLTKGEVGTSDQRAVKAESIKGVVEAKKTLEWLGVPTQIAEVAKKIADIPINMNHYSLMVGLARSLKKAETLAIKTKDAAGEQQAKKEQRALAQVVKDILSTTDAGRDASHAKAAGELAKFNVHEDVINDVLDFAEEARVVTQRALADAETTTETVREITVEEVVAEQEAGSLQEQIEAAMESGDWDKVAELQGAELAAQEDNEFDLQPELESDTITLSDEFDANDASNSSFDTYSDSQRNRENVRKLLGRLPLGILQSPVLQKMGLKNRKATTKLGGELLREAETGDQQISSADLLNRIIKELPAAHPYVALARLLRSYGSDTIVEWTADLPQGVEGRHTVRWFGTENSAEALHWQVSLNKGLNPRHVVQTFLHEMVHNHTTVLMRTDVKAAASLDTLRRQVLAALDKMRDAKDNTIELGGTLYGLTDVDEFLAEAFTNPDFQMLLMQIEVTPDPNVKTPAKRTTAWSSFVGLVQMVFGAAPKRFTAFDEVMRLAPEVFHDDSGYNEPVAIKDLLKRQNTTQVRVDRESGQIQRLTSGEVVAQWAIQRNNIIKNAVDELGESGREIATTSYSMMQGDDPQTLGDLKDGSEQAVENAVQRMVRRTNNQHHISNIRDAFGAMSLALSTFDQIVRNHGAKFKTATGNALLEYEAVMRNKNRIAARWQNRGAAIDEMWAKVKTPVRYSEFVNDVTMSELHPDYSWEKQKHLFSAQEQSVAEAAHKKLQARWNKLSKVERATFIATRTFFTAQRKQLAAAALQHLSRIYIKDPEAAKLAGDALRKHKSVAGARASSTEVDAIFDAAGTPYAEALERVLSQGKVRGSYFPLRRFGKNVIEYSESKNLGAFKSKKVAQAKVTDWKKEHPSNKEYTITANDAGEYVVQVKERGVEFYESSGEAREAIRLLKKQGLKVNDEPTVKEEWAGRFDVGATQVLKQAEKKFAVDDNQTDAVRQRNEGIQNAMQAAFVELLAENSIRKSTLQRKNVKGASTDGRRVFAERVFGGSYALADAETMFDQMDALDGVMAVARQGGEGAFKAGQVARELMLRERHNVNDQKSSKFNDWVGSLGFLGFLAGPSYPMINATQPFMVGLPWLGARYGLNATGVMTKQMAKFGPAVMKELVDSGMGLKRDPHQAIQNAINVMSKSGVAGGVEMLQAMRDAGIMDSTFIDAVSEAAKGTGWNVSKTGLFKFAASAPKVVEVLNRTIMATTAYQLEMAKSGNKETAIGVAKEAILMTQFDYSDFNKPRAFKNKVARPFLLFKMYPQGIYGLLVSSYKQATNGTKEEQRIGRNTIMGITASHTIMGGALGGLFMEPVRMLLSLAEMLYPFDDDDEENLPFWDKQRFDNNMRGLAVDLLGDEYFAELAMRGIPRAIGLDLSGRLGLHNLMFMGMSDDGSTKNLVHKAMDQAGGAPLAVLASWERAAAYFLNGDYQRSAEAAAPKSLRDIMGSYRAGTRGLETFNGTRYMQPDEFSGFDHFVKMMGFSPAKTAELQEERWAQMSYDKRMQNRKGQVVADYMLNRDAKKVSYWNSKHPDYAINMGDVLRKQGQQMKDELMSYKGYPVDFGKPSVRKQARF